MNDGVASSVSAVGTGPSPSLSDGAWHHLAVVRNGATGDILFYVDGVEQGLALNATLAAGLDSATEPLTIGYLNTGGANTFRFDGSVDEVALYSRALTAGEVSSHVTSGVDYCAGSAAPSDAPYPDDTISLWPLDEAGGSTYVDAFGGKIGDSTGMDPTPVAGTVSGAQDFDDTATNGIDVPASSDFNWLGTESFTVEVWVKTEAGDLPGNGGTADNEVVIGRKCWFGLTVVDRTGQHHRQSFFGHE